MAKLRQIFYDGVSSAEQMVQFSEEDLITYNFTIRFY